MNTVTTYKEKMFVIREYNNFGDEEPSYRNDILEYLYDIRDGINDSIDIMKSKAARIANGDTWTTINNHDKCVIDPVTHWSIRLSPKTAENDLMVINAIIEEVLGSDDEMFAVVWDCVDFHQMNPRLQVVKKTYIPVYPLKFDKKKLFYLGDAYNANALSVTDGSDELKVVNDFHMGTPFNQRTLGIDMFGVFDSLVLSSETITKQIKGVYVEEPDIDNVTSKINEVNSKLMCCSECKLYWILTDEEKEFFVKKGLKIPKRCQPCRNARKIKIKMISNMDREKYDKMTDIEKILFYELLLDKLKKYVFGRGGKLILSTTYGGVPSYEDIEDTIKMIKEYE